MGRSGRSRGNTHVGDVHTRMNLRNGEVNDEAEWSCNGGGQRKKGHATRGEGNKSRNGARMRSEEARTRNWHSLFRVELFGLETYVASGASSEAGNISQKRFQRRHTQRRFDKGVAYKPNTVW